LCRTLEKLELALALFAAVHVRFRGQIDHRQTLAFRTDAEPAPEPRSACFPPPDAKVAAREAAALTPELDNRSHGSSRPLSVGRNVRAAVRRVKEK
jgi:hypothetical protein